MRVKNVAANYESKPLVIYLVLLHNWSV